jgi:hypothetical protein
VDVLLALEGSAVELVTCAVLVIHPPLLPVMVVVIVNGAALAPFARDPALQVTTRVLGV